jgi:hypothetical protein
MGRERMSYLNLIVALFCVFNAMIQAIDENVSLIILNIGLALINILIWIAR